MPRDRVVIVGAGVAGLVSAFALAARGLDVTVLERRDAPGGKMRQVAIGPAQIDSGPTVFTMRWVFDELFAAAGRNFSDHVRLQPLETLARHAWDEDTRLDLFADEERTIDAIGGFAGAAEAEGYRAFCRDTKRIYDILEKPFLRAPQPSMSGLIGAGGFRGLMRLPQIKPFSSMWSALGQYFRDPRLQQLFGRYATYCGSSPYLAPATLMLVAHVERSGVWSIDGGMHALAQALAEGAKSFGATIRYGQEVSEVLIACGRACGVRLASGERIEADAVIVNADVAAVAGGLFGINARRGAAVISPRARSLSAVTWSVVAKTDGFPLSLHNVFFSRDYHAEFDDIFRHDTLPNEPTVYVCAQDRGGAGAKRRWRGAAPGARQRAREWRPAFLRSQRRWNNAHSEHSGRWSGAAFKFNGGRKRHRSRRRRISTNCSRRRAAPCTAAAHTDGPRRFSVREREPGYRDCIWRGAARIRARACRWRRCRAARRPRACSRT